MRSLSGFARTTPVALLLLFGAGAGPIRACPVCGGETGKEVRAGLFDENFGFHVVATLLPFPVFLGIAACMYYGPPKRRPRANRGVERRPVVEEKDAP
jgi:hypothetical protein